MSDSPLMLGVSGLRGIVGESLTPEVVFRYCRALHAWYRTEDPYFDCDQILIGHDGRAGHESIYYTVIAAFLDAGWIVHPVGRVMTPTLGYAVQNGYEVVGAVMVTASHNPSEWNGMKCISAVHDDTGNRTDACAPPERKAVEIVRRYQEADLIPTLGPGYERMLEERIDGEIAEARSDLTAEHLDGVWKAMRSLGMYINSPNRGQPALYRVVVDSVNASGSLAARLLAEQYQMHLVQLHGDNSGIFPHTPEPTAENLSGEGGLCDAVPALKADVGFAQDPDGDRLAIVDEKGSYIGEEYTLVLAAMSILEARSSAPPPPVGELSPKVTEGASAQTPSDRSAATSPVGDGGGESDTVICVNLSTSRMIDDVAAKYGARVVRTAVGEANVVEAMKKLKREGVNVILGGEGNGGVIWPEVTYVRDSLGAMALTLSLMARTGKTVSELVADVPSYAIVKRKQPLAKKEDARPTIEKLTAHYSAMGKGVRVDTQDGVRIDFEADRAWVHVRASNTEPILRLIGEAPTREKVEAVLDEVQRLVDGG